MFFPGSCLLVRTLRSGWRGTCCRRVPSLWLASMMPLAYLDRCRGPAHVCGARRLLFTSCMRRHSAQPLVISEPSKFIWTSPRIILHTGHYTSLHGAGHMHGLACRSSRATQSIDRCIQLADNLSKRDEELVRSAIALPQLARKTLLSMSTTLVSAEASNPPSHNALPCAYDSARGGKPGGNG